MTTSVRELLDQGAAAPSRPVDVDGMVQTAIRRRRNRRGITAALVLVVALVAVLAVVDLGGEHTRRVVVPPADATLEPLHVPEGWTSVSDPDAGLALAVPAGWHEQHNDDPAEPRNILVVGSAPRSRLDSFIAACTPSDAIPSSPGTWVEVYEYLEDAAPFRAVGGGFFGPIGDRPTSFLDRPLGGGPKCGRSGAYEAPLENESDFVAFRDGGRLLYARVVTVGDPERVGLQLGFRVLDTLRVGTASEDAAREGAASHDDLSARATLDEWLDPPLAGEFEDFAEIAALMSGPRRHGDDVVEFASLHSELDDLTFVDGTHATFHYTLFGDDGLIQAHVPGALVKIDGHWKVSRETECALIARIGFDCPPR